MKCQTSRQFLGLDFRKHIKDYARIAEPLTRLTKKNTEWSWGEKQDEAVRQIKNILIVLPWTTARAVRGQRYCR